MSILVRHAMTESPQTASPDMNAWDAAGLMKQLDVGVVPVTERDHLVGLVTDRDLVLRVLAERREPGSVLLRDIATKHAVTVTPDMQLSEARELMEEHKIRRLPVMKDDRIVGILSLGDVALGSESERLVGETIREISESASTRSQTIDADRGTPDRVQQAGTPRP